MLPQDKAFYVETEDEMELEDTSIEPCVLVPPAVSTLSLNNLPMRKDSLRTSSWLTRFSGILYTLAASSIFTCATFAIKQMGFDLLDVFFGRFIIQIIATFLFARYKKYSFLPGTGAQQILQMLCCLTGAAGFFLYFCAIRYIDLSDVATLFYTRVVWTVLLSIVIFRERPLIGSLIALPLTFLGVVFVTQPSFVFASTTPSIVVASRKLRFLGLSLSIIGAVTSAMNVLLFKLLISRSKSMKPSVMNLQYCITVFGMLLLFQMHKKFVLHTGLSLNEILSWRFLGVSILGASLMIGNILTQKAIKREHPAIFTLVCSSDIIIAIILQNLFTSKRSNLFAILGSALVILSVLILGLSKIMDERHTKKKISLIENPSIINNFDGKIEKC